jgi:hypothetical protein
MSFNFKLAEEVALKNLNNRALFAMVIGASGSGKSSSIGTLPGRTLLIYGSGESHGPKAAQALGGNVCAVCADVDESGKALTPDESFTRLLTILQDVDSIQKEKFASVAIDGAPELEAILSKSNRFIQMCTTDKGKLDGFSKGPNMSALLREVVSALKVLHGKGINVVMTCRADVRAMDDNGAISDCAPKLSSYGVAESLISQFDDILLVGVVEVGGKRGHVFQFNNTISKTSKDLDGKIKKIFNFAPRVTCARDIPELLKADLKKVIELKSAKEAKA